METKHEIQKIEPITAKQLTNYLDAMSLAPLLTDKEKIQFLEISQAFGLNPFKREIYCSKYNNQMSIIVGYETYIKRAERSGQLDGWQVVTEGNPEDNTLKATITIHRKDRKIPFIHEVFYSEYVQKTKEGNVTKFWQKAYTMTKKVAMAQGFRLCFSDELGGMPYSSEEMPEQETQDIQYVPVNDSSVEEKASKLIALMDSCVSLGELQAMWTSFSPDEKLYPNVEKVKDELKVKLSK